MIKEAINKLIGKVDLTQEEIEEVMQQIMNGETSQAQIASFLTALRLKGETVDEITGCANIMRKHVIKIEIPKDLGAIIDTCGTGGDSSGTFNVSTVSAFVAAGCGLTIAKHGNRSVSSKCGSADLLEALGINIELDSEKVKSCINDVGIGFLYAPKLHPAMKYATPVRKQIGIRTIFNILGPLTNPAFSKHQLFGTYSEELTEKLAYVLKNLGSLHCLVVHGLDGLDEVTTTNKTKVSELKNGEVKTYLLDAEDFSMNKAKPQDLKAGSLEDNKKIALEVLEGKKGPCRDIVVLNSACAIYAGDKVADIKEGIKLAQESIDSSKAIEKLKLLKEYTNKV